MDDRQKDNDVLAVDERPLFQNTFLLFLRRIFVLCACLVSFDGLTELDENLA